MKTNLSSGSVTKKQKLKNTEEQASSVRKKPVYAAVKRAADIFVSLIGIIILLPLMLVVKICYLAAGDRDSIFYTQTRVGLNGKPFRLLKFRSMVNNADELLNELLRDNDYRRQWENNQKLDNDPRITKMGNIFRKTSIDEMPQLINVLKGEMSLIGPRPLVEGELEQHGGLPLYHQVKPGITGWWGCNGRSNTSYEERLELEYYYVRNCSVYLDLKCVAKTIAAIIRRDGAL